QPCNASSRDVSSSSTVTLLSPSPSAHGQSLSGVSPSAMLTRRKTSSTATSPDPSQSAAQESGDSAALMGCAFKRMTIINPAPEMSPTLRHVLITNSVILTATLFVSSELPPKESRRPATVEPMEHRLIRGDPSDIHYRVHGWVSGSRVMASP